MIEDPHKLAAQLETTRKEIAYYQNIAQEAGRARLKETEEMYRLIQRQREVERDLENARNELESRVQERTAQLAESEQRYRAMFQDAVQPTALAQNGCVLDANPAFLTLFGYADVSEAIGHPVVDLLHPDHRDRLSEIGLEQKHLALSGLHRDGSIIELELASSGIRFAGRSAMLLLMEDVTERNRLRSEAAALEEKRQHMEKMEAIGLMAGGVAHDLNNVLSGIINYPELILLDLPTDSPLVEDLIQIQKSGHRGAAIVRDMLTISRRSVMVAEPVDLNEVITEYTGSLECRRLRELHPDLDLDVALTDDLPLLSGSSLQISKTIMNLVTNAAEAMPDGGSLRIATSLRQLIAEEIPDLPPGTYLELEIEDSGTGIAPDDIKKIFEPFFTKKVMGRSGTGLGMAIVWGAIMDHNGHIQVESELGRGTCMRIFLPALSDAVALPKELTPEEPPLGQGHSVLVIDDDESQRRLVSQMLTRLNYSVFTAASGEEALDFLERQPVGLLVLDMIMAPGIDGLDTLQRLQAKGHEINGCVIASGYSETERVKQALSLCPSTFLQKPYQLAELGHAFGAFEPTGTPINP